MQARSSEPTGFWTALVRPIQTATWPAWLEPWVTARVVRALSFLLCAAVAWMIWGLNQQREELRGWEQRLGALAAEPVKPAAPTASPLLTDDAFLSNLPARADTAPTLVELNRAAAALGVLVQEVQIRPRDATEASLGQAEILAQLRGSYPNIKAVLREVMARYRFTTLRRLTMRRMTVPQDLQADVALVVWGRALQSVPPSDSGAQSSAR